MKPTFIVTTLIKTLVNFRVLGVSIIVAGLAACGGDDPATGGTPTGAGAVTISSTNAQSVTGAAVDTGMGTIALGELSALGVETTNTAPNKRVLSRLTATVVRKIAEQKNAPASVTGVIITLSCVKGDTTSGTFSLDDFDGTTSVKLTFTNCKFDPDETIHGSMTISNMESTVSSESGAASLNLTMTEAGRPAVTITGGFTFAITGMGMETETTVMTGSSLTMTEGNLTEGLSNFSFTSSFNFATNISTDNANFTLTSTTVGGSFTFATVTAFQTNLANIYPHIGVGHITGAADKPRRSETGWAGR